MQDKSEYEKMVNVTYVISCSAYAVMACVGYLMFGNSAQSEVENTFFTIRYDTIYYSPTAVFYREDFLQRTHPLRLGGVCGVPQAHASMTENTFLSMENAFYLTHLLTCEHIMLNLSTKYI